MNGPPGSSSHAFLPLDSDYNVIILGMSVERDLPQRTGDILSLLENDLMPPRQNRRAVVYLADTDTSEDGGRAIDIGGNAVAVGTKIKESARPTVQNVATEIGIAGRVDAALSDWSSPSFLWGITMNAGMMGVMRDGGVVFIRHVHRKILKQYTRDERMQMAMTGMTGGSYAQDVSALRSWRSIVRAKPALAKKIQVLGSADGGLPEEFPLPHPEEAGEPPSVVFQYLRWKKIPPAPVANRI